MRSFLWNAKSNYSSVLIRNTRTLALTSTAAVLISWTGLTSAQSASSAWYGVELPGAVSDPTKPVISMNNQISEFPYKPIANNDPRSAEASDELNGKKLHGYLKEIIDFSYQSKASGALLWGRNPGMPEYRATAEWTKRQFEAAGLQNVQIQDSEPSDIWFPVSSEVKLHGADTFGQGSRDIVLQSAFPHINQTESSRIPQTPITAPLIFVGEGGPTELAGKDVRGKIAVAQVTNPKSVYHNGRYINTQNLVDAGAVGIVIIYDSPGNMHFYQGRNMSCSSVRCYAIGGEDGFFLKQVMNKAAQNGVQDQLRMTLQVTAERRRLTAPNIVGFLSGKSDKYIIVNAHADGHFAAAGDNGDGFATLIGLAHYFGGKTQSDRQYNYVFVAAHGHHHHLNGPAEFVKANPNIVNNSLLYLNIEHTAQINTVRALSAAPNGFGTLWDNSRSALEKGVGVSNMSPAIVDLWVKAIERFDVNALETVVSGVPGDLSGYRSTGKPLTQIITAGTWYHSSGDVIEAISVPELERVARAHAWFIENLDKLSGQQINP